MKYTTHEICADIASTMDRVRELDIEGHARAAALQCLASARAHLTGVKQRLEVVIETPEQRKRWPVREGSIVDDLSRPIQTSPFPQVALASEWPPSAADNQRVRNTATQAFRKARELLKGIAR